MHLGTQLLPDPAAIAAVAAGRHGDPFSILGMHAAGGCVTVCAMLPQATRVEVIDAAAGAPVAELTRLHADGFFGGAVCKRASPFAYRLRLRVGEVTSDIDDPYRFGLLATDVDLYLFGEGTHHRLYELLGSHPRTIDGVTGAAFTVWAPSAARVSVVGDFNDWDGRRAPMRRRSGGVWEIFLPGVGLGDRYKYELLDANLRVLPLKADPFAFACERPPATASIVAVPGSEGWHDAGWLAERAATDEAVRPQAIYEVHLGSWRRGENNRYLTYAELADQLFPYVLSMGFTHVQLMPVAEHPFDGSWGYQTIGMYAPTSRFGTPAEFAVFIDRAHAAGLGVLVDWVPAHFPTDEHGLARFDGTALYEHADPRQGFQPDWNTYVFNFGRNEVANYLLANALFWLRTYHVDGLRIDAVASMLYLDYSRKPGEWIPNRYGGRENVDAIALLERVNTRAANENPGAVTIAEESTAWPKVSGRVEDGGLGFTRKWNMGWMHDALAYVREDPINRRYHQDQLTFSFMYAFSERFVLPLSHDEVVYGKGSLLGKMPGDSWQRFANLRAFLGYMYAHPGKKLLFMGGEFGQEREWNHDRSLDWELLRDPRHRGVQDLVRDCNALYRRLPALHEFDDDPAGLEWITSDRERSVVAFVRRGSDPGAVTIALTNFTPVVREGYRVGVPLAGTYREALNTDDVRYGGSGVTSGVGASEPTSAMGKAASLLIRVPPLATLIFERVPAQKG